MKACSSFCKAFIRAFILILFILHGVKILVLMVIILSSRSPSPWEDGLRCGGVWTGHSDPHSSPQQASPPTSCLSSVDLCFLVAFETSRDKKKRYGSRLLLKGEAAMRC